MDFREYSKFIPEVKQPEEKNLSFKRKSKWTLIVLLSFFILTKFHFLD